MQLWRSYGMRAIEVIEGNFYVIVKRYSLKKYSIKMYNREKKPRRLVMEKNIG